MPPIEPDELVLPDVPGMEAAAIRRATSPGIHVVIGPNNAGKTRLLKAVRDSSFTAEVRPSEAKVAGNVQGEHAQVREEWHKLEVPIRLFWPRDQTAPKPPIDPGFVPPAIRIDDASIEAVRAVGRHYDQRFWAVVRAGLWPTLRMRPAVLVPTDRYGGQEHPLTTGVSLNVPEQWSAILADLANSPEKEQRDAFTRISDAFTDVTDGLLLRPRQAVGRANVYVEDHAVERPLDECGDGLRDLIGIFLYAARHPSLDLLIDEPGLRLHPHSQRRLLKYLEGEAVNRAVWIASHDGVFVGAPAVSRRFYIHRDRTIDQSTVKELLNKDEARTALVDLGWTPGDAFLADRVLYCEGESDRITFEAALSWLAEEDVTWAGTVVAELGGDGEIWQAHQTKLQRRLETVNKVAPHAAQAALLDKANQPPEKVAELERSLKGAGLTVSWLPVCELENLWLTVDLVEQIGRGLAEATQREHGRLVTAPSRAAIEALLSRCAPETDKGSDIFKGLCATVPMDFRKTLAARIAMTHIRELAPTAAETLKQAIKGAFVEPGGSGANQR